MQTLQKIQDCKKGRRCNRTLSCSFCGLGWQKGKFKGFMQCFTKLHLSSDTRLTYIVISSNKLGTLREKSEKIFELLEEMKELKKRAKLPLFFGRLEFSFGKKSLGFNPHLNLLIWGDDSIFKELSHKLNLRFWSKKKTNDKKTVKSIVWYMLKFNNIGIEEGEAVRKILDTKRTIVNSREFKSKNLNYIDDFIDIDFSFMGTYPIRSKKEIDLMAQHKIKLKKLREELKTDMLKANNQMWNN